MNYTVVQADLDKNREDILAVWRRNFNMASEARYSWIYESNSGGTASAWMVKTSTGTVVGSTGRLCRKMKVGDRLVIVGQAIDMAVDKQHRMAGPALMLQKALLDSREKRGISFLYGFANNGSEQVLLRSGYRVLGSFERWTKPLRSEYKVKGFWKGTIPVKMASLLVDTTMKILSGEPYFGKSEGTGVEVRDSFDSRFDALWTMASKRFDIMGERTSDYLNWRFRGGLRHDYRVFCLSAGKNALLGYIVYQRAEDLVSVADFCALDLNALEMLFIEFVRRLRLERAASVSITYLGAREVTDRLKRVGFYKRPSQEHVVVYLSRHATEGDLCEILNKDLWYLTEGDKDV
jgi:hypothetical protein